MSTLFSISDAEFDDLEDEEFLIEACNVGTNQLKNNYSCLETNLRKTGHNVSTYGQNLSDKKSTDINPNCVNGLASSSRNCDISMNSLAKLRPSPANCKIINDGYDYKSGKRQEHERSSSTEPPSKKTASFTKENTPLTSKVPIKNHRCQNEESLLKSNCLPDTSLRNIQRSLSHGLRYTQNTKTVNSSPSLQKALNNRCIGQSKNIGFETPLLGTCGFETNEKNNSLNLKAPRTSCSPSPQNRSNEYLQTDLPQNILRRNIPSPSVNKSGHCEYTNSVNCLRQSPNQVTINKILFDGRCSTPKTRRFPGPAGILPRLEPGQNLDSLPRPLPETPKKKSPKLCQMVSHDSDEEFSMEPWILMQDEIEKRFPVPFDSLAVVVKKAALHQLEKGKVAFLGVLVKTFCPTGLDVRVVLKDPSGEMQGTLHRKVLEEHQIEIGPGCGLLLKQVSVFSPSPRKHYLNITPGNIVEIFPACGERLNDSVKMAPLDTPKRRSSQISSRPELIVEEQTTQDTNNVCAENFDDLLEGLDSDDDILLEAMNF